MDTIRVWLEREYDHGRTGAWMLDWPGAFTWGPTRSGALARVTSAVNRFAEWLDAHGEPVATPVPLIADVVDEASARRLDNGYEVNAIFDADRRPVSTDELETTIRRLEFARDDLLALRERVDAFEHAGGGLPTEARNPDAIADGASPGRSPADVVSHVSAAETWFVSRLDPSARYTGPRDDARRYLAASRRFLIENLRRIHSADPAVATTDGKGEEWTLAKLLRRALYHSLDHLDELDRRLALAERRVDRVELRRNAELDATTLKRLFAAAGLGRRASDSDETTRLILERSTETISAWDDGHLVGFARIVGDEVTNGYISTVAVAPRWQDRGLGSRLMRTLMDGREGQKLTLDVREGAEPFYERLGFVSAPSVRVRPRQPVGASSDPR